MASNPFTTAGNRSTPGKTYNLAQSGSQGFSPAHFGQSRDFDYGPQSKTTATIGGSGPNPEFGFMQQFANQANQAGATPAQQALANIFGQTASMASQSRFNQNEVLNAGNLYGALAQTSVPGQAFANNPLIQQAQGLIERDLGSPPGYAQDAIASQQQAAEASLNDRFAAGQISDAQLRAERRRITDGANQARVQAAGSAQQQSLGNAFSLAQMQQQIVEQEVQGVIGILGSIARGNDPTDQQQLAGAVGGGFQQNLGSNVANTSSSFGNRQGGISQNNFGTPTPQQSVFGPRF